jgi:hypothetical protein
MAVDFKIPDELICRACGQPMKVVHHDVRAAALGVRLPEGDNSTIECCDQQIIIDDEEAELQAKQLLESYHTRVGALTS